MTGTDISLAVILLPAVLALNYTDGISAECVSQQKRKTKKEEEEGKGKRGRKNRAIITFDPLLSADT